jgi:histidinol dehydrogenase
MAAAELLTAHKNAVTLRVAALRAKETTTSPKESI